MGTLSKTLSGCGGYIAASHEIVEYLRCSVPASSIRWACRPLAAAALAALGVMRRRTRAGGAGERQWAGVHGGGHGAG